MSGLNLRIHGLFRIRIFVKLKHIDRSTILRKLTLYFSTAVLLCKFNIHIPFKLDALSRYFGGCNNS